MTTPTTTQLPTKEHLRAVLKVNGYETRPLEIVNVGDILPKSLEWIWDGAWESCPCSMGDSVYTLTDGITIRRWINEYIESETDTLPKKQQKDLEKFNSLLDLLQDAQVYINVE